jgi:hypothetical protein
MAAEAGPPARKRPRVDRRLALEVEEPDEASLSEREDLLEEADDEEGPRDADRGLGWEDQIGVEPDEPAAEIASFHSLTDCGPYLLPVPNTCLPLDPRFSGNPALLLHFPWGALFIL